MGPPLKAAENLRPKRLCNHVKGGFNGAAAKSSGKSSDAATEAKQTELLQWGRR